jgi:hypothetical protein
MRQSFRLLRLDTLGNDLSNRRTNMASALAYADEILDVDKGEITRYRRRFETATETLDDASPTELSVHGKTALVDMQGGKRQISWEGSEPISDSLTQHLEEAFKSGKDKLAGLASFEPLPDRPVKVGESWNIDVTAMVKQCETKHGCKLTGATGLGTLREVYQGAKGPCAKVDVRISIPLRTIKNGNRLIDLNEGSGSTLEATYDFALANSDSHFASTMCLNFQAAGSNAEVDGTTTRIRLEATIEAKERWTAAGR